MHLEAKYLDSYNAELQQVFSEKEPKKSPCEKDPAWEALEQLIQEENEKKLQNIKKKDARAYQILLNIIYPLATEIAELQGGDVILNIQENEHTGTLEYFGNNIMNFPDNKSILTFLGISMKLAASFYFGVKDGLLYLWFFFDLYKTIPIDNHTM